MSNNFSSIEVSNIDILSLFKILIFLEKPINRSKITERVGSPVDETRGEIGRRDAQHSRNQNAAWTWEAIGNSRWAYGFFL